MSYNRWMPVQYSSEMYHHGVKGMKWGVRRYQPYSDGSYGRGGRQIQRAREIASKGGAKDYQRALNKLDRVIGDVDSDRQLDSYRGYRKSSRISDKMDKAWDKGDTKRYDKLIEKSQKVDAKYTPRTDRQTATIEAAKKLSNEIIKEAETKGYSIASKQVTKLSKRGKAVVANALLLGNPYIVSDAAISVAYRNRKIKNDASWNSDRYFEGSRRTYTDKFAGNYNPYLYKGNKYTVSSNRRR